MKKKSNTNKKSKNRTNMKKEGEAQEITVEHVQKILEYFVAEGIAKEVTPGHYSLTKEGKQLVGH